jgi:hypothetical protein
LIFGKPQAAQSGCRYSGRPALHPSGQQSCSKLLQTILFFRLFFWTSTTARDGESAGNAGAFLSKKGLARLLGRYYEARKAKACETMFRAGARFERGCRANARNDSKRRVIEGVRVIDGVRLDRFFITNNTGLLKQLIEQTVLYISKTTEFVR